VKDTSDISYLRRRNDELSAQLRKCKKEESRLQSFLREADAKMERLSTEIFKLRRRIGSKSSSSAEPERLVPPLVKDKDRQGIPRINTPKKEPPKKKSIKKKAPSVESWQIVMKAFKLFQNITRN